MGFTLNRIDSALFPTYAIVGLLRDQICQMHPLNTIMYRSHLKARDHVLCYSRRRIP